MQTPPVAGPVRIAIYLRVSTEEQAKKGYSLPEQREACRQRAAALAQEVGRAGAPIQIDEFVDTFGGDVPERPVLEQVRAYIRERRPAWFICMDPDRFSRHLTTQLLITEEIERAGTRLDFVQHQYQHSAEGQLFYQIRGAIAQFEKAKIVERTNRGKQGKIKAGRRPNGAAPYGYRHVRERDELEVHEPEAGWVRLLFRWVACDGLSPYQAALRLDREGAPTRLGGKRWRRSTVVEMLRNTTYIGQMRCNRHDARGLGAIRRLPREKRRPVTAVERPPDQWRMVPVPALVDPALFEQVQQRLAAAVRRGNRPCPRLLSMLVQCGACGGRMAYSLVNGARLYLRCHRRYADLAGYSDPRRCPAPHHRAEPVEEGVWAAVCAWLLDPDLVEALRRESAGGQPRGFREEDLARLRLHLAEKEREQAVIMQKQLRGLLSEAVADTLLAAACEQARRLSEAIAGLEQAGPEQAGPEQSHHGSPEGATGTSPAVRVLLAGIRTRLTRLTPAQRRSLLLQLVRTVVVHPDGTWQVVPV